MLGLCFVGFVLFLRVVWFVKLDYLLEFGWFATTFILACEGCVLFVM